MGDTLRLCWDAAVYPLTLQNNVFLLLGRRAKSAMDATEKPSSNCVFSQAQTTNAYKDVAASEVSPFHHFAISQTIMHCVHKVHTVPSDGLTVMGRKDRFPTAVTTAWTSAADPPRPLNSGYDWNGWS